MLGKPLVLFTLAALILGGCFLFNGVQDARIAARRTNDK